MSVISMKSYDYCAVHDDFKACSEFFQAIGSETRQGIILYLITVGSEGARVGQITEQTHLSRPAVSHHLKILKDAKVVSVRQEGAMNFYFIDIEEGLPKLEKILYDVKTLISDAN